MTTMIMMTTIMVMSMIAVITMITLMIMTIVMIAVMIIMVKAIIISMLAITMPTITIMIIVKTGSDSSINKEKNYQLPLSCSDTASKKSVCDEYWNYVAHQHLLIHKN